MKYDMKYLFFASLLMIGFCACGTVFEDGEDCPFNPGPNPTPEAVYKIKFDDSYNMSYADAFSSEISSIALFVIDNQTNKLVWSKEDTDIAALKSGNYEVILPLNPGTYDFVAWCGITKADNKEAPSFALSSAYEVNETTMEQLTTQLVNGIENGEKYIHETPLTELHNGILLQQTLTMNDTTLVIPLVRNTNNIRVALQRTDGTDLDAADFDFSVEASNGIMNYNNELMADKLRDYRAFNKKNNTSTTGGTAVVAEMSIARMVLGKPIRFKATYKESTLINIPLITYALLVKGYYNEKMTDQEFLDRQNDWNFIFFLNDQNKWEQSNLYINDWHVIKNDMIL